MNTTEDQPITIDLPELACDPALLATFPEVQLDTTHVGCQLTLTVGTARRLLAYCSDGGWNGSPVRTSFTLRLLARRLASALGAGMMVLEDPSRRRAPSRG